MAAGRRSKMSQEDRRWVTLAAGLLALWLQLVAPFALVSGMQIGMAGNASAADAAADAVIYLCQPLSQDHGPDGAVGKHLLRIDCQICQSLHVLANGMAPVPPAQPSIALPDIVFDRAGDQLQLAAAAPLAFSSRAPPAV
ncbi:MAG: hypothetical protein ABWY00_07965 [Dongiaceae bacterium]